jgi:hypothetical protein
MSNAAPHRRRWFQRVAIASGLAVVGMTYCAAGLLMYRQRRIDGYFGTSLWHSDALILLLPAVVALIANASIVRVALPSSWPVWPRMAVATAAGVVLAFLEFWAYMFIAVNRYGV